MMSAVKTTIPEGYVCPISSRVMVDPVTDPTDSTSYERVNLIQWIHKNHSSPLTRKPLEESQIVTNATLKETIDKFREENSQAIADYHKTLPVSEEETAALSTTTQTTTTHSDRLPLVLFCVIDNSGSMQLRCDEEKLDSNNNAIEHDGYSRLDLVKHSLNTIITSLTSQDSICIIKFDTTASIIIPLQCTNNDNTKRVMIEKLRYLQPQDQTNIWDGMKVAIDEIGKLPPFGTRNVQVYLFTDGEPTLSPPRPIADTITLYINQNIPVIRNRPIINTFGYGYSLDSRMLYSIAQNHGGIFGYIPDASMVGSVFIKALSNSLSGPCSQHGREPLHPSIVEVSHDFVQLLKNVLLDDNVDESKKVEELKGFIDRWKGLVPTQSRPTTASTAASSGKAKQQQSQASSLNTIEQFVLDLIIDCTPTNDLACGQIAKAIEQEYFKKWGSHYLRSVLTAYERMICTNFKDRAMQHFSCSKSFLQEQTRIEAVFMTIESPKPSVPKPPKSIPIVSPANVASMYPTYVPDAPPPDPTIVAPPVTTYYYSDDNYCFREDSVIMLADGSLANITSLTRGSKVMTIDGPSEVEVILCQKYSGSMYSIGDCMTLTPSHPISINGESFLPKKLYADIDAQKRLNVKVVMHSVQDIMVYNVVLVNRAIMTAPSLGNDYPFYVATLGNNPHNDEVFAHPFFATERVVEELKKHSDYDTSPMLVLDKVKFDWNNKVN